MTAKFIFNKKKLLEQGMLHLPSFFKGGFLQDMQKDVQKLIDDKAKMVPRDDSAHFFRKYQSTSYSFVNQTDDFSCLKHLANNPILKTVLCDVFPEGHALQLSLVQHNKAGKGQAIPWHQDVHHDQVNCGMIYNFLLYPFDTFEESGAFHYVPGSQKMGRLPKGEPHDPLSGQTFLTPKAGDLVIGDCLLFHRVNHNRSDRDRISINLRFRASCLNPELTQIGVYRNGQVNYSG